MDFPARSDEDWELVKFAYNFIEHSNNVENLRGKTKPTRMSIERICAGPAVPLIYEFYKSKLPELPRTIETTKLPDQITAFDIVSAAFRE